MVQAAAVAGNFVVQGTYLSVRGAAAHHQPAELERHWSVRLGGQGVAQCPQRPAPNLQANRPVARNRCDTSCGQLDPYLESTGVHITDKCNCTNVQASPSPLNSTAHLAKVDVRQTGQQVWCLAHKREEPHKVVGCKGPLHAAGRESADVKVG